MLPSDQLRHLQELQTHPAWAQILAPWLSQSIQTAYRAAVYADTPEQREAARHTVINLEKVRDHPQLLIQSVYAQTTPATAASGIPTPSPVASADGGMADLTRLGESLVAHYSQKMAADLGTPQFTSPPAQP